MTGNIGSNVEMVAFSLSRNERNRTGFDKSRNKRVVCKHCKIEGHSIENCLQLIGFPEWYKGTRNGKSRQVKYAIVGREYLNAAQRFDTPFDQISHMKEGQQSSTSSSSTTNVVQGHDKVFL